MKKPIMKKTSIFFLCFLFVALLMGCTQKDTETRELNMALSSSPITIDAQLVYDVNSSIVCRFFNSTLYEYNIDKELVPGLAESYEISDDGLRYTFKLKKDLKWSDGRALTSEDFVFGFKRFSDPAVGSNAVYLITDCCKLKNASAILAGEKPLSELGVYAPDKSTFVVELEEPCTYFLDLITNCDFAPCNEDFFHSAGKNYSTSQDTVISCGSFIVDRYEPLATQIHFKKNPYYYNSDIVKLSGVNIQIIANSQQALMCYEAGTIDVTEVSGEILELAEADPELEVFTSASLFYVNINQLTGNSVLKNKNIRMALSKSIDRKDICENLLKAGNVPMTRIIPPGFYTETDGTDFSIDTGRCNEYAGYDPDKALEYWKKGLSELGVSSVNLGFLFASDYIAVAEAIANQMEKRLPGLKLELKGVPFKDRIDKENSGEYDLVLTGWNADYSDPTSFLALFYTSDSNHSYTNEEYDSAYALAGSMEMSKNPDERNKVLHKVEDIIMEDAGVIPVYTKGKTYLIREFVSGFQTPPTGVGVIVAGIKVD